MFFDRSVVSTFAGQLLVRARYVGRYDVILDVGNLILKVIPVSAGLYSWRKACYKRVIFLALLNVMEYTLELDIFFRKRKFTSYAKFLMIKLTRHSSESIN